MPPKTFRQRLRKKGIRIDNWKQMRGEIRMLCISGQCLFKNNGIPWDILEIELRGEGWLYEDEELWDVLRDHLFRRIDPENGKEHPWEDNWTEDDFKYFYGR